MATRRTALIALQSLPDTGMMRIVPVKQREQGTAIGDDAVSRLQGGHNSRDGARIDRFVGS